MTEIEFLTPGPISGRNKPKHAWHCGNWSIDKFAGFAAKSALISSLSKASQIGWFQQSAFPHFEHFTLIWDYEKNTVYRLYNIVDRL